LEDSQPEDKELKSISIDDNHLKNSEESKTSNENL